MTLDELEIKWKEQEAWDKAHPVQAFMKDVYYFFRYRLWRHLSDAKYSVKWGFQRMFRGYDDADVWGYWHNNATRQVKILKKLKEIKHGYPVILLNKKEEEQWHNMMTVPGLEDEYDNIYQKRWEDYMDAMIFGWQAVLDEDEVHITDAAGKYDHEATMKEREKHQKLFKKGMKLYTNHYQGLWD